MININGYDVEITDINRHGYVFVKIYENNELICQNSYCTGTDDKEQSIEYVKTMLENELIAEEKIVSPCPTYEEYKRRLYFLEYIYPKRFGTLYSSIYSYGAKGIKLCYNSVIHMYCDAKHAELVKHHEWLYAKLKMSLKPSIFYDFTDEEKFARFLTYYQLIPLAEPDDPRLSEAQTYIIKNAREAVLTGYQNGFRDLAIGLVQKGYIKKPTLKELLDLANNKEDTQFLAILLDIMEGTKKSKSRFSL